MLWLRGCVYVFRENISNLGMRKSSGTVHPSERKPERYEGSVQAQRLWAVGVCFPLLARECERGAGETYMDWRAHVWWLMDG